MAVRFDAANERYLAGGISGAVATITCWARIAVDTNAFANIWVLYNGSEVTTEAGLGTDSGGTQMLLFDSAFTTMTGPNMTVGTWYCFAAVMNSTAWDLYYGTSPNGLTLVSNTMVALSSPASMTISHNPELINGNVANFKVWTAALTQAEVEAELAQYQPIRTANLLRYHPLVNAELVDYSGNGNTLTAGAGTPTTEAGPPIRWDGRLREQLRVPAAGSASPAAGLASLSVSGQNATVTRTGNANVTAATLAVAGQNASPSVEASAGVASMGFTAFDGTVAGDESILCADFTTAVALDQHSASVSISDRHEGAFTLDEHVAAVGVEEHYATVGICGRS